MTETQTLTVTAEDVAISDAIRVARFYLTLNAETGFTVPHDALTTLTVAWINDGGLENVPPPVIEEN